MSSVTVIVRVSARKRVSMKNLPRAYLGVSFMTLPDPLAVQ
jgi:hypothetical protein